HRHVHHPQPPEAVDAEGAGGEERGGQRRPLPEHPPRERRHHQAQPGRRERHRKPAAEDGRPEGPVGDPVRPVQQRRLHEGRRVVQRRGEPRPARVHLLRDGEVDRLVRVRPRLHGAQAGKQDHQHRRAHGDEPCELAGSGSARHEERAGGLAARVRAMYPARRAADKRGRFSDARDLPGASAEHGRARRRRSRHHLGPLAAPAGVADLRGALLAPTSEQALHAGPGRPSDDDVSPASDRVALPIDPLLPEIVRAVRGGGALVLEAPPGAGKTTRVPRALVESGAMGDQEVLVLQPRRLPTRLAARRVAAELGEEVGKTVGYQMRFEDVGSRATRLRFLTEGVLTRRLLSDPELPGVGAVVLDEFHERHLATDLALALLRRLQQTARPDLKLLIMSATLEAAPVAAFLGGCPSLRSEGRRFEVALEHLPAADERPLEQQVLAGVKRVLAGGMEGDLLVFLPGAAEIRRAREACEEIAGRHQLEIHALHGDLPPADQDRAVTPGRKRKIILSTNVAETSVTIEGVGVVIDSGLARIASHSPWSGLPVLQLGKVSKSSAVQRAGRAGRTRAGTCLRLYTKHDFDTRRDHDVPEIRRMDLAESVLALRASGVRDPRTFPFFEAPPTQALEAAESLLRSLGAVAGDGGRTEIGRRLLAFPVHPRQARVVVEAERRGVGQEGAAIAALLGERDIRREARSRVGPGAQKTGGSSGPSDLLELLELLEQAERGPDRARSLGLEPAAVSAAQRVQKQLARVARRGDAPRPSRPQDVEQALLLSVLAGYPDRVAKRRKPNAPEVVLSGGGSAALSELSVVREPELLVAVDVEERPGPRGVQVLVRLASAV